MKTSTKTMTPQPYAQRPTQRLTSRTALLLATVLCAALLGACTKTGAASVNIHGVNYTEGEFTYWVQDPSNKDNHGGGEMVDSFAAGGTLCCYELPRAWRPGIKVEINTIRYINPPDNEPTKNIEEIREKHLVEVPPYVDGKPGELWVVRSADGSFTLVSSDYQPDHAKWPGAVKGWPVPTLEYRRKDWDLRIKIEQGDVRSMQEALVELDTKPESLAKQSWDRRQEEIRRYAKDKPITDTQRAATADRALLAQFTGPTDPRFIAHLKQRFATMLRLSEENLKRHQEGRP